MLRSAGILGVPIDTEGALPDWASAAASRSAWRRRAPTWSWRRAPGAIWRRSPPWWRGPGAARSIVPTDVTDIGQLEHLVDTAVGEFGRLDVAVNNAGGAMPRAAMDTSAGFLERAFHFNVTAPFALTKLAARRIVDTTGTGAVVNISSRSASMTQTSFAAYGAVKAALDRLTRNMAPELAPRVRLNAIDVGGVATRSLDVVLTDEALRRQFLEHTPMGRPGEPEDIACAVVYLASDASSWVTGKVFEIDGGTEAPAIMVPVAPLEPPG